MAPGASEMMQHCKLLRQRSITRRRAPFMSMASRFDVKRTDGEARLGELWSPTGKRLSTPALLLSTTHGHCLENENSAISHWKKQHHELAVAMSGVHLCAPSQQSAAVSPWLRPRARSDRTPAGAGHAQRHQSRPWLLWVEHQACLVYGTPWCSLLCGARLLQFPLPPKGFFIIFHLPRANAITQSQKLTRQAL